MRKFKPVHPGVIVQEQLEFLHLKAGKTAEELGVSRQHLHRVMTGQSPVTKELAARLGHMFGNGARIWLAMQADYDAWVVQETVDVSGVPVYV